MDIVSTVNGKTALFGVLGDPIEHTKSPFIHNTLFKHFNINAIYLPVHVKNGFLEDAIVGLRAQNFVGFNVTVPYKKEIIKYLDEVSNDALLMGAVNTVKNIDGRLKGYNTDAEGFVRDFEHGFNAGFKDKKVLMLGGGGTARAIAVKLCLEGVKHLTIVNRTEENARNIVDLLKNNYGNVVDCLMPDSPEFSAVLERFDAVVNTTPVGMSTYADSTPFNMKYEFNKNQLVYDVVYSPKKTQLLKQAEDCGCPIRNGFGMLINQGVSAFEIWTGKVVPKDISAEILNLLEDL